MGQAVSGRIDVEAKDVKLEIDLPWMLAMLGGRIQKEAEARAKLLLE
jgi:hypothetical protein